MPLFEGISINTLVRTKAQTGRTGRNQAAPCKPTVMARDYSERGSGSGTVVMQCGLLARYVKY